jgi:hypothetical protein
MTVRGEVGRMVSLRTARFIVSQLEPQTKWNINRPTSKGNGNDVQ